MRKSLTVVPAMTGVVLSLMCVMGCGQATSGPAAATTTTTAPASQPTTQAAGDVPPTVFVELYTDGYDPLRDTTVPITGFEQPGVRPGDRLDWWRQELENIVKAKIDVVNLIGGEVVRGEGHYKQYAVMLKAMAERQAAGKPNAKIAFFYDGMGFNGFRRANLDTDKGMDDFYRWVRRFYEFMLNEQNAGDRLFTVRGAYPIFIYHPEPRGGVTTVENKLVPYVKARFAKDFPGKQAYLIFSELYWNGVYSNNQLKLTNGDNYFNWGASMGGISSPRHGDNFDITTIGPGFDDRERHDQQQEGWGERIRLRHDGEVFRRDFARAIRIRDRAPWLILETWNFTTEGSEITNTKNYGDLYVRICGEMIPAFKAPMTVAERQARQSGPADGVNTILGPQTKAGTLLGEGDFIQDWLILGPFALPEDLRNDPAGPKALSAQTVPGEATLAPKIGAEVAGKQWQAYRNPFEVVPERIDLGAALGEQDFLVAYLSAEVVAPEDGAYTLLLGADDLVKVWVNGQPMYTYDLKARGAVEDEDRIEKVQLHKGSNRILLKVVNLHGGWGAVVRLATPEGRAVRVGR